MRVRGTGAPILACIVALALLLRLPLLGGPLFDYDEGVYWQSLRALSDGHQLFGSVYSSQPPGFLLTLLPFYLLLGHSLAAARAGVLTIWLAGLGGAYGSGRALLGRRAGLVAAALWAVDPLMLRQSVSLMADAPCAALSMVAVALAATAARRTGRPAALLAGGAGAALGLAVLTKLLGVAAAVPVILLLAGRPGEGEEEGGGGDGRRRGVVRSLAPAALGLVLTMAVVVAPELGVWRQMLAQSIGLHFASRGVAEGGVSTDLLQRTAYEIPLLALAIAGLLAMWRVRRGVALVVLAWTLGAVVVVAGQHPLWPHHLTAVVPALTLGAAGVALPGGVRWDAVRRGAVRAAAAAAVVAAAFTVGLAADPGAPATASPQQVLSLRDATAPGDVVVTDDQFAAASADRDTPPELVDTSLVRILSGDIDTPAVEDVIERSGARAVFFGTSRFDHLAGLRGWVEQRFPRVLQLGDGRVLFVRM